MCVFAPAVCLMPDGCNFKSHGAIGEMCEVFGLVYAAWCPTAGAWLNIGDGGDVLYGTGSGYHQVFFEGAMGFVFANLFMLADAVVVFHGVIGVVAITGEFFKDIKILEHRFHGLPQRHLLTASDARHMPCTHYRRSPAPSTYCVALKRRSFLFRVLYP